MELVSTSWSCNRCGAAFIGTPPQPALCDECARLPGSSGWLQPRGLDPQIDALRCKTCGALPMRDFTELLHSVYEMGKEAGFHADVLVLDDWPAGVDPRTPRRQRKGDPS
jgi:hypothetical protein